MVIEPNFEALEAQRRTNWRQDGQRNIPDPAAAVKFIDEVGVASLYLASSEFPNLYHGFMSDPNAKAEASWDSPAAEVYTWRWSIGKPRLAFYGSLIAKKPTWISWSFLPTVIACFMDKTPLDELRNSGQISDGAYRIGRCLEHNDEAVSTALLREMADYPTGKENRAAYQKALEELERRLLVAKVFSNADDDDNAMLHGWTSRLNPSAFEVALAMDPEKAFSDFLRNHIAHAVFIRATPFAKALNLPIEKVTSACLSIGLEPTGQGKTLTFTQPT